MDRLQERRQGCESDREEQHVAQLPRENVQRHAMPPVPARVHRYYLHYRLLTYRLIRHHHPHQPDQR